MAPETLRLIRAGELAKGDVLGVAQTAGIMAAKRTPDLIPMCHLLLLDEVGLNFRLDDERHAVEIEAWVRNHGKTGVEMEALTAVSVAALTIYDMCKAVDRRMVIGEVRLERNREARAAPISGKGNNRGTDRSSVRQLE